MVQGAERSERVDSFFVQIAASFLNKSQRFSFREPEWAESQRAVRERILTFSLPIKDVSCFCHRGSSSHPENLN